jgi:hypothetical protein
MNLKLTLLAAGAAVASFARAAIVPLYTPSGTQVPADQPWLTFTALGPAIQTGSASGVSLDTTGGLFTYAGYSNYTTAGTFKNSNFPTLNRATGFSLRFDLRLSQEFHNSAANTQPFGQERAGFSVILLGSDRRGIEIGFRQEEVFTQPNATFLGKGEWASVTPQFSSRDFEIVIFGSGYRLLADGTAILSGPLRDYSAFGAPYSLSNFVFLGDNTTEALSSVQLGRVELNLVPEPVTVLSLSAGLAALIRRRKTS